MNWSKNRSLMRQILRIYDPVTFVLTNLKKWVDGFAPLIKSSLKQIPDLETMSYYSRGVTKFEKRRAKCTELKTLGHKNLFLSKNCVSLEKMMDRLTLPHT